MENKENYEEKLQTLTSRLITLKKELKEIRVEIINVENQITVIEKEIKNQELNSEKKSDKDIIIAEILSKYMNRYKDAVFLTKNIDAIRKELRANDIYLKTIDVVEELRNVRNGLNIVESGEPVSTIKIEEIREAKTKNEKWNLFQKITGYKRERMYGELLIIEIKKIDLNKEMKSGITYHSETSKRVKEWKYVYTCLDGTPDMRYKENGYPIYATDYIVKMIVNTGYKIELTFKNECRDFFVELKNHLQDKKLV